MKFSKLYAPTLKEAPADTDIKSQEYLIRGGFIRKVSAGVYSYLPLGWKVIKKIEQIVREEMDKVGSQEIMLPIIQPAELWKKSGRWEDYGPEMMKLHDRHQRDFTLGPTHEEIITHVVKNELISYKQMPTSLYQIATKFRDEIRPRFGVLRAREFIMKDAYSFHTTQECLDKAYEEYYNAYSNILKRIGVSFVAVEADTGAIGGNASHEFQVLASQGESTIFYCEDCNYYATDEKAESKINFETCEEEEKELNLVDTPNTKTIEQVSEFLKTKKEKIIKAILFVGKNGWKLALISGNYEINLSKLRYALKDQTLEIADADTVKEKFNIPVGFIGPINIENVELIADESIKNIKNGVCGGMRLDTHYTNVNIGRDFNVDNFFDIRIVKEGEACPKCGGILKQTKGIECGQVFKLGTKYSEKMEAYYTDDKGKLHPYVMGCYGWGVSRTLGAVVQQLHDDNGILWPLSIAPFEIAVVSVTKDEKDIIDKAEEIYNTLKEKGYDVVFDERTVSGGFKFKDIDLIGIPLKVIVGKKLRENMVEIKLRYEKEGTLVKLDSMEELYNSISAKLKEYDPVKNTHNI